MFISPFDHEANTPFTKQEILAFTVKNFLFLKSRVAY